MRFLYGQNGLVGFIIDGITYTYRKNLFGDIIGIFSCSTSFLEDNLFILYYFYMW